MVWNIASDCPHSLAINSFKEFLNVAKVNRSFVVFAGRTNPVRTVHEYHIILYVDQSV